MEFYIINLHPSEYSTSRNRKSHAEIGFNLTITWEMQQIFLIKPHGSLETYVTAWHIVMIATYKQST